MQTKVTDEMTIIRCLLNQINKPLSTYNRSTFQDYKDYTVTLLIVFNYNKAKTLHEKLLLVFMLIPKHVILQTSGKKASKTHD